MRKDNQDGESDKEKNKKNEITPSKISPNKDAKITLFDPQPSMEEELESNSKVEIPGNQSS